MSERKYFDPSPVERIAPAQRAGREGADRQDGRIYVYHNDDVRLAVNVAIATRRPLLLSGPSGCGKSTLARNVAFSLGYRYYEQVITARTEARDLLYRFDAVRRLNDAQSSRDALPPTARYVDPGVLWWAFDRDSAVHRGSTENLASEYRAHDPSAAVSSADSVVLIDEIDKADPDLPNSLLVPLGSFRFAVDPINTEVRGDPDHIPLIFITNNGERDLPATFVRRCVSLTLTSPGEDNLLRIAREVVDPERWDEREPLFRVLARRLTELAKETSQRSSIAEYLDAVRACCDLNVESPKDPDFEKLLQITMTKAQPVAGSSR